jgi:hypothetical protein
MALNQGVVGRDLNTPRVLGLLSDARIKAERYTYAHDEVVKHLRTPKLQRRSGAYQLYVP